MSAVKVREPPVEDGDGSFGERPPCKRKLLLREDEGARAGDFILEKVPPMVILPM